MRVLGKSGNVIVGLVTPEFIEQQERIHVVEPRRPQEAAQLHTGPFLGGNALEYSIRNSVSHVV
ncbi:MAG: hypothetical protein LAP85_09650 [Acidobacteriia bacterium]|nr:hypothetical protein [Terriglobia bacterium]